MLDNQWLLLLLRGTRKKAGKIACSTSYTRKALFFAFLPRKIVRLIFLGVRNDEVRREAICIFTDLTKKEASNREQRSKLLFDTVKQLKQEQDAASKDLQERLDNISNASQKNIVTHRFEPTSKCVLLFIGGLALSLVISIWGNLTQWREHQDWEVADLKYRALKMVLPSDDPNVRYIEKNFSVCPNKEVIEKVRTRVNIYEDSIRYHNEMIQMAAIKDSIANSLFKEANEIKKKINLK